MKGNENTGMLRGHQLGLTKPESGPKVPGHPNWSALPGRAVDFPDQGPGVVALGNRAGGGEGAFSVTLSPHLVHSPVAPPHHLCFPVCPHPATQSSLWPGTGLTELRVTSPQCVREPSVCQGALGAPDMWCLGHLGDGG